MRYIDSWLTGLGLEYIIPKLKANGITTPKKLALLTLRDMYEVVGVEDAEDRKKLYFLIQRLHTILSNKPENQGSPDGENEEQDSDNEDVPAPVKSPDRKSIRVSKPVVDDAKVSGESHHGEEDLRLLRRHKRTSNDASMLAKAPLLPSPKQQSSNLLQLSEGVPYEIKSRSSRRLEPQELPMEDLAADMSNVSMALAKKNFPSSSLQSRTQQSASVPSLAVDRSSPPVADAYAAQEAPVQVHSVRSARLETRSGQQSSSQQSQKAVSNARKAVPQREESPPVSPPDTPPPAVHKQQQPLKTKPASTNDSSSIGTAPAGNNFARNGSQQQVLSSQQPSKVQAKYVAPQVEDDFHEEQRALGGGIEDMAIRVVVRKRPLSRSELAKGDRDVMQIEAGGVVLVHEPKVKVDLTKVVETQAFAFDDAFDAEDTNEAIYARTVKHLVDFVFDGGKASCFAYGQTGSGKTFSMMGSRPDAPAEATVNAGLYVLAARDIFAYVKQPKFQKMKILVSCFEIYGGKLFDLLNNRGVVKCLEDAKQQVQLPGLTEHLVKSTAELLDLMAMAHTQRSTGSTGANAESSRSHQVMQIVLRDGGAKPAAPVAKGGLSSHAPPPPRPPGGKLSFVDLAGSERGADTTHNSKQTRMEGAEINTSLLALKEVIRSLERKHGHTPFRGSKLTQVLKDSFVGDRTRTCMVACVSPSHTNCEHTLNTLRYADRVKEHQAGGGQGGAHADSHSKYDSMAYDYVPPKPGSAAQDRPHTAGSAMPSAAAKKSVVPLAAPAPVAVASIAQPSLRKPTSRAANEAAAEARNPSVPKAPSRPFAVPALEAVSASGAASKIPSASADQLAARQRQQEIATKQARLTALKRQSASYEDSDMSSAGRASESEEGDEPPPPPLRVVASTKVASGVAMAGGHDKNSRMSIGKVSDSRPPHKALPGPWLREEPDSSSAYEDVPPKGSSRNKNRTDHGQIGRYRDEADDLRYEAIYRQSTAAGYAPPEDDDEGEEEEQYFEASPPHRRSEPARGSFGGHHNNNSRQQPISDSEGFAEEGEDDEASGSDSQVHSGLQSRGVNNSSELIQQTVGLLSAHKLSIAEMVEVMKEEMELVQEMENVDDRDAELYVDRLQAILEDKARAIGELRDTLHLFQQFRRGGRKSQSTHAAAAHKKRLK